MNIDDLIKIWQIAMQHPYIAFLLVLILLLFICIISFLKSYFSEQGRLLVKSKKEMAETNKNNIGELKSEFPDGYQLFSIIGKQIIPYKKCLDSNIKVDWSTAKILNVTPTHIEIMLPDAQLPGNCILKSNMVIVSNQEGLFSSGGFVINGWTEFVKILKSNKERVIAVVGYRKINR